MSDPPPPGGRIVEPDPASKQSACSGAAPSDLEAVARAAKGDHEAFRVLVTRYQGRAYRLALRVMRDEEQARDVVQEAFLKAYRSLDRFEARSSFYTWFYRVVMNLCIDAKRRQPPGRMVEWDEGHALEAPVGTGLDAVDPARQQASGPAGDLERAELRQAIRRAIEVLPDDARQTLLLREVDGLSYSEIAKSLGIPKGTVMSRLHHARRRLRALLAEQGVGKPGEEPW
ncbi:MAG: RNA polymerase sigma factor [Myxococcota bacterium]